MAGRPGPRGAGGALMRKVLVGLSLVAVGVAAATLLGLVVRNHRLADALVDDVLRLSEPRPRPVHRGVPVGTTYGACLGPLLDENSDAGVFYVGQPEALRNAIDDVIDGGARFADLPARVQEDVATVTPWLDRALACTLAPATGGDNADLGMFTSWEPNPRGSTPFWAFNQARIAAVAIRADLERGDAERALARCADVLAMLRDSVPEKGLMGAMHGDFSVRVLAQPCGAAVEAAPPSALRQFVEEVRIVRSGFVDFAELMELERVQVQFLFFGGELSSGQRARLSPTAQRGAQQPPLVDRGWYQRPVLWLSWPGVETRLRRLGEAARSPDRAHLFEQFDQPTVFERLIFSGIESPPGEWERFAQRYEARARGLDLLESAARVSLGEAPLPGVKVTRGQDAVELSVPWVVEPKELRVRIRAKR